MIRKLSKCEGCVNVECALSGFLTERFDSGQPPQDSEIDEFMSDYTADCPGKVYESALPTRFYAILGKLGFLKTVCGQQAELDYLQTAPLEAVQYIELEAS